MILPRSTAVPNSVFDVHLKNLKLNELKVLLVIIRQTIGWIETRTKSRKVRDWISHSQFICKTGLSRKSISTALDSLIQKKLVLATNHKGQALTTATSRRGHMRIYYSCGCDLVQNLPNPYVKFTEDLRKTDTQQKVSIPKEIFTKREGGTVHVGRILERYLRKTD